MKLPFGTIRIEFHYKHFWFHNILASIRCFLDLKSRRARKDVVEYLTLRDVIDERIKKLTK